MQQDSIQYRTYRLVGANRRRRRQGSLHGQSARHVMNSEEITNMRRSVTTLMAFAPEKFAPPPSWAPAPENYYR